MTLNLPFKHLFFYKEKPIEIVLNIGTLEAICDDLKIDFWQIGEKVKENEFDFSSLLLYYGYITACQKKYKKPKYNKTHASIWYNYMSIPEKKKFIQMMTELFGKMSSAYKGDKKKVKTE